MRRRASARARSTTCAAAEEAFIASTVREVMPIAVIDDIELPAAPGPVTEDAHARFQARVERELAATPA